jgi:tetraacyldisaccharide 4'-kinase
MKLKKPKFWDDKKISFLSIILFPLTAFITINNFILNFASKKKLEKIKTICVGNIYVGGTGKTPLTIKLYRILRDLNYKVSTVKKFYKNQIDEQIILSNKTKLIVSNTRLESLKKAIQNKDDFIIFDDGLQDKKVDYDLKFVCFNSKKWIGNGFLIPSGPLREKISSLKKYDVVFLNGNSSNIEDIKKEIYQINPNIEIFETLYKPINLEKIDLSKKYIVFSGIGNSNSFKETLIENNINVIKEIIFPDHYRYKKNDIKKIKLDAKKVGANIITTEKDYVKLTEEDKKEIKYLEISLELKCEKRLIEFIKKSYEKY